MTEPHFMTIAEASAAIRARRLSPVELTQSFLKRIKMLDGQLDSYLMVLEEIAVAAAKQAEREVAAGRWKGPLHGIPIGLKDIYNTAGVRTTGHSALFRDHVPTEDAATVTLLREAGAIVLRKARYLGVRDRRCIVRPALAAGAQSLEQGPRSRRLVVRLGRGGGGGPGDGGDGD